VNDQPLRARIIPPIAVVSRISSIHTAPAAEIRETKANATLLQNDSALSAMAFTKPLPTRLNHGRVF